MNAMKKEIGKNKKRRTGNASIVNQKNSSRLFPLLLLLRHFFTPQIS